MKVTKAANPSFIFWFLILFAATQLPLYYVQYPDIVDFPNHLARFHVLMHLSESETLQRYYELRGPQIGTALAMEVIVPVLGSMMPLMLALKVFASLAMLLLMTGAVALGRTLNGRFSYLLLGVLIFANNLTFQQGLFNYIFSVGLALWLLSTWIAVREWYRYWYSILFTSGCVLLYFCHLSALGIYALGVLGYELGRIRRSGNGTMRLDWREWVLLSVQFIPVAILHLFFSTRGSYVPSGDDSLGLLFTYKAALVLLAPGLSVSGYAVGWIVGFVVLFVVCIALRKRVLLLARPARWVAIPLMLAVLLLPHVAFGSSLVDTRLLPVVALILWCGLSLTESSSIARKIVTAAIAVVVIVISLQTAFEWDSRDGEYRDVRAALRQIPEGSKVAVAVVSWPGGTLPISQGVAAWSVIDRSALLSSLYLWPFQPVWVAYRPAYVSVAQLARADDVERHAPLYDSLKTAYDYVLVFGTPAERAGYSGGAETLHESSSTQLVRTGLDKRH
jgi:hypothetical protein